MKQIFVIIVNFKIFVKINIQHYNILKMTQKHHFTKTITGIIGYKYLKIGPIQICIV